jgi:hypothetical protein
VPRPSEELYDTQQDPCEFHNLAEKEEYRVVLDELRTALDRWIKETNDVSPEKRMVDMYDSETGQRLISGPLRLRTP